MLCQLCPLDLLLFGNYLTSTTVAFTELLPHQNTRDHSCSVIVMRQARQVMDGPGPLLQSPHLPSHGLESMRQRRMVNRHLAIGLHAKSCGRLFRVWRVKPCSPKHGASELLQPKCSVQDVPVALQTVPIVAQQRDV